MYTITGNTALITGQSGKYDSTISNPNVRYGRNAISEFYDKYLKNYTQPTVELPSLKTLSTDEFSKQQDSAIKQMDKNEANRAPLDFKLQYMPQGKLNKGALMGAAYEEMGKRTEIPTEEMTQTLESTFSDLDVEVSAEALDLNKDGKVDVGEYASSILTSDSLSNYGEIKGVITNKGLNLSGAYANKANYEVATAQYKAMYEIYGLEKAARNFTFDKSNLI